MHDYCSQQIKLNMISCEGRAPSRSLAQPARFIQSTTQNENHTIIFISSYRSLSLSLFRRPWPGRASPGRIVLAHTRTDKLAPEDRSARPPRAIRPVDAAHSAFTAASDFISSSLCSLARLASSVPRIREQLRFARFLCFCLTSFKKLFRIFCHSFSPRFAIYFERIRSGWGVRWERMAARTRGRRRSTEPRSPSARHSF